MSLPDDELEGEVLDFTDDPTTDEDLPWVVLFASVLGHPIRILVRAAEWRLLFGGPRADNEGYVMRGEDSPSLRERLFGRDN